MRTRSFVAVSSLVALVWLVGCSGTKSVPKGEVEDQSRAQLATTLGQEVPPITCPGDLEAAVGTVMVCSITSTETGSTYDVTLTVTSVDSGSGRAAWDIQVADKPRS